VGQHARMVGQHEQEWWVNMVRNLYPKPFALKGVAFQGHQQAGGVVGVVAGYNGYIGANQFIKQVMRKAYLLVFQNQHSKVFNGNSFIRLVFHPFYMTVTHYHLPITELKKTGVFDADGAFDHIVDLIMPSLSTITFIAFKPECSFFKNGPSLA